jgi:amidase
MGLSEYGAHDALGLAALVREKQASPRELVDAAIAAIERANPALNAVVTPMFEEARQVAERPLPSGPFAGVPFLIKDLLSPVAGVRFTEGTRALAEQVADHDATIIQRYRAAGLILVGKTNTPEFGLVPVTESLLHGPARNPWDHGRTPGGSSGGSAAAVAAGMVPAAHGGDGGGSLRIPASCCGLFGFKPTRGRSPASPDRSEGWGGFTVEHAVTRSVRDSAALLDVIGGWDPEAPYAAPAGGPFLDEVARAPGPLRIALSLVPAFPGEVHADCQAAARDAARLCAGLGHNVEEVELVSALGLDRDAAARDFFTVVCAEVAGALAGLRARVPGLGRAHFERDTWLCGMIGRRRSAVQLIEVRARLQELGRRAARFFARFDVVLSPTLARPPLAIGALKPHGFEDLMQALVASLGLGFLLDLPGVIDQSVRQVFSFMPFTPLANITGQPSFSAPLFWNEAGLPIGSMFTGRFGDDATLFRLAAQLETARPWAQRRPKAAVS